MNEYATSQKVKALKTYDEDFEFYPTTAEIMEAMKNDLMKYLRSHANDYDSGKRGTFEIQTSYDRAFNKGKKTETLRIGSFLDIGSGDGRVLDMFEADKKYGIEIARAQADDLIRKGVFLIGRDFWDVTLIDQHYSLVYSNPPFSQFET